METFKKISEYPLNAYALLWFVLCTIVVLVPLIALVLLSVPPRYIPQTRTSYLANAPCLFTPKSVHSGSATTLISSGAKGQIYMQSAFGGEVYNLGQLSSGDVRRVVIPSVVPSGLYVVKVGNAETNCKSPLGEDLSITAAEDFNCEMIDFNANGKIEINDALPILEHFQETDRQYDVNKDGIIDIEDALLIKQSVGKAC